ncbi:hypothetical protein RvY_01120-2 [Ramazzottius varieornatus]|uniref:guanylate cyclase n=1 Tax=Ramazzottius varieornatus TaxID=947166 RepID=A0A1D1UF67_RAMVA|nr:hypothetical protein RvY_01120-2 [Ramazzottius varieornatus]
MILSIEFNINDAIAEFWRKVLDYSMSRYNYTFKNHKVIDPVVTHFYDAMVMYASVVRSMLASNLTFLDGHEFASFVGAGFTFHSPLNGNVSFNDHSDRQFDYVMRSMEYKSGKYGTLITFPAKTKSIRVLGRIEWGGSDVLPPNTPRCGFNGDSQVCLQEAAAMKTGGLIASVVTPVVLLFAVTFVAVFVVKRFFDGQSDPYWWRIFTFELDFPAQKHPAVSSKSLTKSVHSHKSAEADPKALKTGDEEDPLEHPESEMVGQTASYHGQSVSLQPLPEPLRRAPNNLASEAAQVRALLHPNIQKFVGIAVDETNICEYIVGEVCPKGTLRDLIADEHMNLDWEFKNSLIKDVVNGMTYLHGTRLGSHGALSDENCLIDSRFVLKITGIGLRSLRDYSNQQPVSQQTEDRDYRALLWRAPEHLRRLMPAYGTQKGDVYRWK